MKVEYSVLKIFREQDFLYHVGHPDLNKLIYKIITNIASTLGKSKVRS